MAISGNGDILFARSTDGGQTFSEPDNISEGNTGVSRFATNLIKRKQRLCGMARIPDADFIRL